MRRVLIQNCKTLQEAERIARDPNAKRYSDVEDALRELRR